MASRGRILTEEEIQRFIDRCNDSGEDSENDVCGFLDLCSNKRPGRLLNC